MTSVPIKGYNVGFPYATPYDLQKVYMEKVLTCLDDVSITSKLEIILIVKKMLIIWFFVGKTWCIRITDRNW